MEFSSHLTQAIFLKRYKRFLAEIVINNQEHRVVYCPNMGSMVGCDVLGSRMWFSHSSNTQRKFPDTWELVEVDGGHLVCINTQHSIELVTQALEKGTLTEFKDFDEVILSPPLIEDQQFDLLLQAKEDSKLSPCVVQINSVTMGDEVRRGFFPDAPTQLGVQQLQSLIEARHLGYRAVLLYCVLHTGIEKVFPSDHIDPEYGALLRSALISGVEVMAYKADISLTEMHLSEPVSVCIPARLICSPRPEKSQ